MVNRQKTSDEALAQATLLKMKEAGERFLGNDYAYACSQSDERLYCSELARKDNYISTGLKVEQLQRPGNSDMGPMKPGNISTEPG